MYRQYCLLPAPKHTFKIIISYFPGATRFPYYISSSKYCLSVILKLIDYSCSSYPTRASYSGQVDGFRNPMKNELKTTACLEIIGNNTNANFLNLPIDKARKTHDDKQLYLITHFTKQTLSLNYLLLTLNVAIQLSLNFPKQKNAILFLNLNSCPMVATSSFGSLSTLLYTSDQVFNLAY